MLWNFGCSTFRRNVGKFCCARKRCRIAEMTDAVLHPQLKYLDEMTNGAITASMRAVCFSHQYTVDGDAEAGILDPAALAPCCSRLIVHALGNYRMAQKMTNERRFRELL